MRILHTADWHAGRSLGRRSLDSGLESALQQLVAYAVQEKVDALLLAGDVFDHTRPPTSSQQMVYRTLMQLCQHQIPVALIAGNHDSVGHWQALKPLLELAHISVVSELSTGSVHTLATRSGPLQIASLPWPNERLLSPLSMAPGGSETDQLKLSWADKVARLVQVLCQKLPSQGPRLLLSHLMINGSQVSCSERSLSISETYAVASEIFPPDLNYVALGHVHQPQLVACGCKASYAGSLQPLDFGEAGQDRGFYRVELEAGRPTQVEFIPLTPQLPLYQVEIPRLQLEQQLESLAHQPGLYKVVVQLDTPETGLADLVRRRLPNALVVRAQLTASSQAKSAQPSSLLDPLETFRQYHQQQFGAAPQGELLELFASLLQEDLHETA